VNIIAAIFMALITATVQANSIYETPDAETRFKEAQRHVKELMDAGKYQEASKFMSTSYKMLACEAAEQKAGKSAEEGAAACAGRNTPAGLASGATVHPADSSANSLLGPGFTVRQRPMPGSSTMLDGSTPSLFVFDPRTVPGSDSSSRSSSSSKTDPWTGSP
jgi:hypothetical protein